MLRSTATQARPAQLNLHDSAYVGFGPARTDSKITIVCVDDEDDENDPMQWLAAVQQDDLAPRSPQSHSPGSPCSSMSSSLVSSASSGMTPGGPAWGSPLRAPRTHAYGVRLTPETQDLYGRSDCWLPALQDGRNERLEMALGIDALETHIHQLFRDVGARASLADAAFEPALALTHYINATNQAWLTRPAPGTKPLFPGFLNMLDAMTEAADAEQNIMVRRMAIYRSAASCTRTLVNALTFDTFIYGTDVVARPPTTPAHLFAKPAKPPLRRALEGLRRSLERTAKQLGCDKDNVQHELGRIAGLRPRTTTLQPVPNPFFASEPIVPRSQNEMLCITMLLDDYTHTLCQLHVEADGTQHMVTHAAQAISGLYR